MTTNDETGGGHANERVIHFHTRAKIPLPDRSAASRSRQRSAGISEFAEFERTEEQEDYRHRMIVNAAALAFTVVLASTGIWMAESMAVIRKNQDCVLMGRPTCARVPVPAADHWSANGSDPQQGVNGRQP